MRSVSSSGQQMPIVSQGRVENVTAGASSTPTVIGIGDNIGAVQMTPDEDCYFLIGRPGVVVTALTGTIMRSNGVYFWAVDPGDIIAFLQKDTSGNVNITELLS